LLKRCFSHSTAKRSGSILIVCFFVLVTLSMFTLTVGYAMRQKIQVLSRLDARQKLRFIGDAGVQKAIYVLLSYRDRSQAYDSLGQGWSRNEPEFKENEIGDGQFSVFYEPEILPGKVRPEDAPRQYGLIDEERKINLNLVKSPEVLRRLFKEAAGLGEDEAAALVDSIRDWSDEDASTASLGAESRYYKGLTPPYAPRNGKLVTLAELRWVKGMKPEIYRKVRPYVTLDSSGLVNLNTASKPVLAALGFSRSLCDKIAAFRRGRDEIDGTADDQFFEDLSRAVPSLANASYLDDNAKTELEAMIRSGALTVKSQHFTAQVVGRLKHKTQSLQISAVFNDKGVINRWEEAFVVS
jgi:type II secretory pathway component PulK